MTERKVYLKYIGNGSYLPDVPARDLTKEEAEYHGVGRLVDTKLYELVKQVYEPVKENKPSKRGDE